MRKNDNLIYGKVPPQAVEFEKSVLGVCMLERDAFEAVLTYIKSADYFYKEPHKLIWQAMLNLFNSGDVVDMLTITEQLRKMGKLEQAGGAYEIMQLSLTPSTVVNVTSHAMIVAEKFLAREAIREASQILTNAYDETKDVFDTLSNGITGLSKVNEGSITKLPTSAAELAINHQIRVSELQHMDEGITGVPTGYVELDNITNGWQKTDLIILAARPSVGKSAYCFNLAINAAMAHYGVAIFSLEMGSMQIVNRMMSNIAEIEMYKFGRARAMFQGDMQEYDRGIKQFSKLPIFIDDQAGLNIIELRSKCVALKKKHDIQLIIIDYLQLMDGVDKNSNREQEISKISRGLKKIAKDLEVPVIALSQLSRGVEHRQVKVPTLADLRESGAIEQDADVVMFLYRPEYYGINNNEMGQPIDGLTEVHFAKHRNGAVGDKLQFKFEKQYQRFVENSNEPVFDNPAAGITAPTGTYQTGKQETIDWDNEI